MFKNGDLVKIAAAWLNNEKEAECVYKVVNVNEVTKRCSIELLTTTMHLHPTEIVSFEMIEKI